MATITDTVEPAIRALGVVRMWRCEVKHDDLTAAAVTEALTVGPIHATKDVVVLDAFLDVGEAFTRAGAPAVTADVGAAARGGDEWINGADIDGAGWEGILSGVKGTDFDGRTSILSAGDDVRVTVTVTGHDVDELTAGEMFVFLRYYELP